MRKASLFLTISASIFVNYCLAQENESKDHVVYLIGNTASREINISHLAGLKGHLFTENNPFSIIHLGDILQQESNIFMPSKGCPGPRLILINTQQCCSISC